MLAKLVRLCLAIRRNRFVRPDAELTGGEHEPVPGRHGNPVTVSCEGRPDRRRGKSAQDDGSADGEW